MPKLNEEQRARKKAYRKGYYLAHKEDESAYRKAYHHAHKEEENSRRKAHYQAHREEEKARHQAHREEQKARNKAWRQAHKEQAKDYCKIYAKTHRDARRARQMLREARKKGVATERIDFEFIKKRDKMRCGICGKKVLRSKDLTFDHIIPLSKGGPHANCNLQVAHRSCNSSRGPGRIPGQLRLAL